MQCCFAFFSSYLCFLLRLFTIQKTAEEGGGYLFNSSLLLPPASQTFRYYPDDYCRELTSSHSYQPDLNQEPLVSEHKSLTTKLRSLFSLPLLFPLLIYFIILNKHFNILSINFIAVPVNINGVFLIKHC